MSRRLPGMGLGLAIALLVVTRLTGQTVDATRVVFNNSIKAVPEASAESTSLEATPVTRREAVITRRELKAEELAATMDFAVSLSMRHYAELEARIGRGEIISRGEMAAKYDPAAADYNKVAAWIKSEGMTVTHGSSNHLVVFAQGTVSQVQEAFAVDFARVTGVDGVEYSSAITAPSVPAEVATGMLSINGLQPHVRMRKNLVRPAASSLPADGYETAAVARAYNANGSLTGAGQTIAIVIDTEPSEKDVTTFWKKCGVNQSWNNITFIKVNRGQLSPPEGEETLDVEWGSSMAPAAKIRLYATVDLFPLDIDVGYQQIIDDLPSQPGLNQVSLSFGDVENDDVEGQMETDDEYFAELASAGVTVFAASGDGGSRPDFTVFGSVYSKRSPVQVENPASDPNVTAVGGTNLQLTSGNNVSSETAWSVEGNGESGATGGGASQLFGRPTWQMGKGVPSGNPAAAQLGSSPPMRLVPDVAAISDPATPGFLYLDGQSTVAAGTSLATPCWAGFCALINQARAKDGQKPVGLLGPRIYPFLGSANFRDITSGNNGDYNAGAGYDMCTGVGAPNVGNLVQALINVPVVSAPPSNQTVDVGQNATFTVTANGTNLSYQWQQEAVGGSTWSNLSDGAGYAGTGTAMLTVNEVTPGMSGDQFRCVITDGFSSSVTSDAATLVVVAALTPSPEFTQQAQNVQAGTGQNASFSVVASGNPTPTFQWQISTNAGGSWSNLTDGNGIAGSATGTLMVLAVTQGMSGDEFRCVATNSSGSVTSNYAILTVMEPLTFLKQPGPASQAVKAGATVTFSISATATSALSYQWKKNGVAIGGATNATLVLKAVTVASSGNYTVVATSATGNLTSSTAVLVVVKTAPKITQSPKSQAALAGSKVTFTVTATGEALSYAWRKGTVLMVNTTNISGVHTAALSLMNVSSASQASYSVVVTNPAGKATSAAVKLVVK